MKDDWIQVAVQASKARADDIEAWLFEAGALSVTLKDGINDEQLEHAVLEPEPGEVRLWDDITIVGLFSQDNSQASVHIALQAAADVCGLTMPVYQLALLSDQIWERTWMDSFKPAQFGHKLWICPSHADPVDSEAVTIKLDPGMAFGTGTHATTAQCLEWMGEKTRSTLQPLAGKTVIDYGCGSGVLAIAALLLGANHAWAVDIDSQALLATHQNAQDNQVLPQLSVGAPEILDEISADIVLANILFKPLMNLSGTLARLVNVGGTLVMSGMLEDQMEPLRQKYVQDFRFCADSMCDNWALMIAIRR